MIFVLVGEPCRFDSLFKIPRLGKISHGFQWQNGVTRNKISYAFSRKKKYILYALKENVAKTNYTSVLYFVPGVRLTFFPYADLDPDGRFLPMRPILITPTPL